ncbi:P-loop containing nucleoside triphosphate hydrolase protein [Rickenella mellea]|uniref:P-loop containing nucleoside triphosphate hydrolase protein n=1 Tax=Rickenella mellea TaxID=50990 RepID=A0A4R5XF23_9AGAM|nr:P-loop containing nucleoside triphosphate hydrolase protein [Rickenella mellea]
MALSFLHIDAFPLYPSKHKPTSLFDLWFASRTRRLDPDRQRDHLPPGSPRPFTIANIFLAWNILKLSFFDMLALLWGLNPIRTVILIFLTIFRGLFPAFRGYSQAMILDEIQSLITSGNFPSARLGHLVVTEGARMLAESFFDSFANHNEAIVHSSVRYLMEYRQMEQRLRLDLPTLADPTTNDLLHESDLFVRSFMGMGGFGLFSPLDLVRVLSTLSELVSQLFILWSTSRGSAQLFLLAMLLLPTALSTVASWLPNFTPTHDLLYTPGEAQAAETQERMRTLAHSEPFRSEVVLFGLGPWILESWANARKVILGLDGLHNSRQSTLPWLLTPSNMSEMFMGLQNLPFLLYSSSTSLGSLALYRNSVQSLMYSVRSLTHTVKMSFQSVFLMGAFFAAMSIEPRLSPDPEKRIKYETPVGGKGMKIEAKNLSYTYPGNVKPTLRNVSFTLEAGETLAIVGYNGSGKSTLANVLLRIFDFDDGQLLINGTDIRRLDPNEYHSHVTALFQVFSKFNATVRENVGIGDVGRAFADSSVYQAACTAGAGKLIQSLPRGLDTQLECMGHESLAYGHFGPPPPYSELPNARHGLSGGEWQRLAISRAFMRARTADLLLLDEPTSHLDAHAQNEIFKTIDSLCREPTGGKIKTVIFITHQMSIAKRADKIAMFENGTITEFGTHEELLARPNSHYASLCQAAA